MEDRFDIEEIQECPRAVMALRCCYHGIMPVLLLNMGLVLRNRISNGRDSILDLQNFNIESKGRVRWDNGKISLFSIA